MAEDSVKEHSLWPNFKTTVKHKYRMFSSEFSSLNKNVLLRERKRHTVRRVASTCSLVLSGGYPPSQDGGYPWVWTNKQTETITFPHPSYAGGNYDYKSLSHTAKNMLHPHKSFSE